jgi:hypothetical protein
MGSEAVSAFLELLSDSGADLRTGGSTRSRLKSADVLPRTQRKRARQVSGW